MLCLGCSLWILSDEAILIINLNRLTDKIIFVDIWHDLCQIFQLHILAHVEKQVRTLFIYMVFVDFLSVEVIVFIPFLFERILGVTHVMSKAELAVVIDNAMQIVRGLNVQVLLNEAWIVRELSHVEVADREVHQVLQLSPLVAVEAESFELDDQDWRWNENFHTLVVHLI